MAGLIFSWMALALPVWSALVFVGGPSAPAVAGFGLCLAGSLAVLGVHLGTARHCASRSGSVCCFQRPIPPSQFLAWSSLMLRRTGHVKWKGRTYNVVRKDGPGPL